MITDEQVAGSVANRPIKPHLKLYLPGQSQVLEDLF